MGGFGFVVAILDKELRRLIERHSFAMRFDGDAQSTQPKQSFIGLRQAILPSASRRGVRCLLAKALLQQHLFGVVCPTFDESVAVQDFLEAIGRRCIEAKKLDIVPWVRFVDGHDIGRVIVEGREPLLFLIEWPIGFYRSDIVIGIGRLGFERPRRVHIRKTRRTREGGCLIDARPDLRGDRDNFMVHDKLPNRFQVFSGIGDQALFGGMIFLNLFENRQSWTA